MEQVMCKNCNEDVSNLDYVVTANKEIWCVKCWIIENDVDFNLLNLL